MTDQSEVVPSAQSGAAPVEARYRSLDALREAHSALRRSLSKTSDEQRSGTREEQTRSFLTEACNTGIFLADSRERRVAQSILDYWSAELASSLSGQSLNLEAPLLARFDPTQALCGGDQPDAAPPDSKVDRRAAIRISAVARQWLDSGRQPGYLLTDDAIEEAAQYKDWDPNLAEFVEASREAAVRQRIRKVVRYSGAAGALVTLAIAGVMIWYFRVVAEVIWVHKSREATTGVNPAAALRLADMIQPLLPPYDFSGTPEFTNISAPKLTLYAPNFSGVPFSNVKFPEAKLPVASFNGSDFSFDGGGRNDFSAAELRQAQFRAARIANTSFAGADLYRASFDRALLCDVDFTGANLRNASFWAVTLDDKTKNKLKQTAWWQALGWPWEEIEKLAPRQNPAHSAEDEQLVKRLKDSKGFKDEIDKTIEQIRRSSAGTVERAVALNNFAWTDAVWGVDISTPKRGHGEAPDAAASNPCAATDLPKTAIQAAQQAVCIIDKLNRAGDDTGKYATLLANLRDTQAYLFMQNNEIPKALAIYEDMKRADPKALEVPETAFRSAIAQYAGGGDKDAAIKQLTNAVQEGRYQPTHELQTLKDYIFPVKAFVDALRTSSNKLWPPVKNLTPCPTPKPAPAAKK